MLTKLIKDKAYVNLSTKIRICIRRVACKKQLELKVFQESSRKIHNFLFNSLSESCVAPCIIRVLREKYRSSNRCSITPFYTIQYKKSIKYNFYKKDS